MSEIENKKPEDKKVPEELKDELVDQVAGGTGDGNDDDGVKTHNGAILLPEVP